MGTVKIDDVRKSYGALEVLHGIDIDTADVNVNVGAVK